MAGPAVLLGYGIAGVIAFLIMRQLGEMVVEEPVSGNPGDTVPQQDRRASHLNGGADTQEQPGTDRAAKGN